MLHNVKGPTCGQRGHITLVFLQADVWAKSLHKVCHLGSAQSKEKIKLAS